MSEGLSSVRAVKICCTCREWKHLNAFHVRRLSKDGLQARCKACFRLQYKENKPQMRQAIDVRLERVRGDNQSRIAEHLLTHPCVDCGEADIRVLDFDHRDAREKRANVSKMMGSFSWRAIEAEIRKCDVVCANCHRRRTSERGSWWRQAVHEKHEDAT